VASGGYVGAGFGSVRFGSVRLVWNEEAEDRRSNKMIDSSKHTIRVLTMLELVIASLLYNLMLFWGYVPTCVDSLAHAHTHTHTHTHIHTHTHTLNWYGLATFPDVYKHTQHY
jgi:hypothetical protein